ncbi:hypothetical protein EON65_56330 [archaeon]|nr:MAG: hypothetical protein EON65_56330 [archaeon]
MSDLRIPLLGWFLLHDLYFPSDQSQPEWQTVLYLPMYRNKLALLGWILSSKLSHASSHTENDAN